MKMRSKKYFKLFVLMIGVMFICLSGVKADEISIDTNANTYEEVKCANYFSNCSLTAIKKVDTNGNVVFCADHSMPLPNGGNGTYTWSNDGTSTNSDAVAYIFENADTSSLEGYMIAQFAVWYFVDNTTFSRYFDYESRTYKLGGGSVTSANTAKVMALIDGARSSSEGNISANATINSNSLTLTSDGKYYISSPITLWTSGIRARSAEISFVGTNTPTGAFLTKDSNATSGSKSLSAGASSKEVVYVKIPVSSITSSVSFNLWYIVNTTVPGASIYRTNATCNSSKCQDLIAYDPRETSDRAVVSLNVDYVKKNKVTISKKSITGNDEIAGATLVVKDSKGATIKSWTTTNKTTSIEVAAGTYTLEETKAPKGYILNKNKITFVVSDDGKVKVNNKEVSVVEIKNTPIIVNISKRSINGKSELPGAQLAITDKDNKVLKDVNGKDLLWTSTTEEVKFQLEPGTYYLSEKVAPKGYELSETIIKFTVGEDGKVKVDTKDVDNNLIIYTNTPNPEEVKTGSFLIYIIIIGTLSVGTATYFIMRNNKNTI